jgi:hypothetical protein
MDQRAAENNLIDATKTVGNKARQALGKGYRRAQRTVTQADAFEAYNQAMEEMTNVVSVQHSLIADLTVRVTRLEAERAAAIT